jgi:hypothetical protein
MPKEEFSTEDPLELVGMVIPGDSETLDAMAEAFVEEYVRLGWSETRLMTLFTNPTFMGTHRIYLLKGEAYVQELVRRSCEKWGIRPKEETNA